MLTQGFIYMAALYCGIFDFRCPEVGDDVGVVQVNVDSIDDC
jgi:hypothetical protein